MSIDKNFAKKYPDAVKIMRELRLEDWEINSKLQVLDDLTGWKAITFKELKDMSQSELSKLKSYCWRDGNPRYECIGIENVKFEERKSSIKNIYWVLTFDNDKSQPTIEVRDMNDKIDNVGDGEWNYGLYRKSKKK